MVNNIDRLENNSKYALNNYKKVLINNQGRKNYKKYKHLPDWVLNKSRYLLKDYKCYGKHRKVFARGALVYVDFGVNVGTELSGSHFAIVLTKNDHRRNDKLNVVPLTSHSHQDNISMNDTILNRALSDLLESFYNITMVHYSIILVFKDKTTSKSDFEKLESMEKELLKEYEEGKNSIDIRIYNSLKDSNKNTKWAYSFLKDHNIDCMSKNIKSILDGKAKRMSKVIQKYSSYGKETFIKISDITTVSKARLKRINEYDPIGNIKVSNDLLNQIDKKIIELYTK